MVDPQDAQAGPCELPSGTTVCMDQSFVYLTSRYGTRNVVSIADIKALHKILRQQDVRANADRLEWTQ